MVASLEPSFAHLIAQAEALAARRHEELKGVHLLAAAGAVPGRVRDVLEQHGAGFRRALDQWERLIEASPSENLHLLRRRVREVARMFGSRAPDATHVLLALLDNTHGSARRVLLGLGVDAQRLSVEITQLGQGLSPQARVSAPRELTPPASAPRGQIVPVMPTHPVKGPFALRKSTASAVSAGPASPLPSTLGRGRLSAGQALSSIPEVGPKPLPGSRLRTPGPPTLAIESESGEEDQPLGDVFEFPPRDHKATGEGLCSAEPSKQSDPDALVARHSLPKKQFPILTQIGKNLTLQAALGQADPVVGRDDEIEQALDVLAKRHGNNPCLIGEAGVGKTSVARGVAAQMLAMEGDERIVIEVPIAELLAGTGVRGALAGRLAALKKEVKNASDRVVLFFDEIHQLFSGDASEEIAGDLKLSLARGELPCIGATTTAEYRRVIENDATLSRRFSAIEVEEPSREDAFLILSGLSSRLEAHHSVTYDEEAIARCIGWSMRYLPGRSLPDKAVSILDLAGARTRRRGKPRVDSEAVAEVVAAQANMPSERLLESDADRMLQLEQILRCRVIGHEQHLERIARILRRNAAGLGGRRPIGTFLLLGPTGVGKTETAKAIAEVLFHNESAMTRIDMAEMSESHAVAKLVGAPPGYIGHDAGGQLTEAVRRRPYQVVLLDEIEKAHPDVLTAFLAVFDEGRMTDSRGRLVDFTNTVVILTSNLGGEEFSQTARKRVGFSQEREEFDDTDRLVVAAARKALAPELFNRIDEVLPFRPLQRSDVHRIGRKLCSGLADEMELSRGIYLSICDSAIEVLLDQGGYDANLGARPLRRMIARKIEAPLAEAILTGDLRAGDTWLVEGNGAALEFDVVRPDRAGAAE